MTRDQQRALALLEALTEVLAQEPGQARASALTTTMTELVDRVGDEAFLPIWARCVAADDALVRRTFSYVLARHSTSLEPDRWITLLWLLISPSSLDDSGVINTLTALEQHASIAGIALAALRAQVGPFLVNAISRTEAVTESALEAINAFAQTGALVKVVSAADVTQITRLLTSKREEADAEGRRSIDATVTALSVAGFSEELPSTAGILKRWIDEYPRRSITSPWSETLANAEQAAASYAAEYAAFDNFAMSAETRFSAYDLHLSNSWADLGRVPYDFFQKLLNAWRRLYFGVRDNVAPSAPEPAIFVLAPMRGSFTTRVLVEPPPEQADTEEAIAVELSSGLGSVVSRGDVTKTSAGVDYAAFLDLVSSHEISVQLGVASSLKHRVRERVVVGAARAKAAAAAISRAPVSAGEEVQIVGTLDAANHRSGHFEIVPADGSPSIKGTIRAGGRNILLRKVIGQQYSCRVRREGELANVKWTLLGLQRIGALVGDEEPALAGPAALPVVVPPPVPERPKQVSKPVKSGVLPARVLPTVPRRIDSDLVPQVDNLSGMIQVVEILASRHDLSADALGVTGRHVSRARLYVTQAARALNLIDENDALTAEGAMLARLPADKKVDFLIGQFETSIVGRAWMAWAKLAKLGDIDPESAERFLRSQGLTPSMSHRRGRTLRRWVKDLQARVLRPLQHR